MNRSELEALDRDALIARAEGAGVTRARILTRPELVDELLVRSAADHATKQRARGLFGRARDLLARVVEQGLHLPDAAERIRSIGGAPVRVASPSALPTVTLAEIYAAQGHRERAVETLENVLLREADHAAARVLLTQLRNRDYPLPPPRLPPEADDEARTAATAANPEHASAGSDDQPAVRAEEPEPIVRPNDALAAGPGDAEPAAPRRHAPAATRSGDAPLPSRYDVDECVALAVDPSKIYVYWEVRERTLASILASHPSGTISLRIVVIVPTWDGPRSTLRDHDVACALGDFFVEDLPPGCVVRAAIGLREGDAFIPVAHTPALETPSGAPAPLVGEALARWTVRGAEPVAAAGREAPSMEKAVARARRETAWADRELRQANAPQGSSERWAIAPWARSASPAAR